MEGHSPEKFKYVTEDEISNLDQYERDMIKPGAKGDAKSRVIIRQAESGLSPQEEKEALDRIRKSPKKKK